MLERVFIREFSLFTDVCKNDCFTKVLEVIKYLHFDFRTGVYCPRGTFRGRGHITQDLKLSNVD